MLTVTQQFKDALAAPVKRVEGYIVLQDGTQLLPGESLQNYTINSIGGFLRTAMSKITVNLLGEQNLIGSTADVYYGVEIDGTFEYVLRGQFSITDVKYNKEKRTTTLTGYDNMLNFQTTYSTVGAYPTDLYTYLQAICSLAGVVLENTEIFNGDLEITEDYYANIGEFTVRDVLEDICEASASYAIINPLGHLELRQITTTGENPTYENLLEYEMGDYWGGINSLVFSRQPQNDDVFFRDDADINSPTTHNVLDLNRFTVGYKTEDA